MKKQKVFVLENKKLKVIVVKCNNKEVVSSVVVKFYDIIENDPISL